MMGRLLSSHSTPLEPSTMSVPPVRPNSPSAVPPLPQVVRAEVQSNDPTQRLSLDSTGHIRISGEASNRGFVPSSAQLSFDGQTVSVRLSGGMSPYDTFKALEAAMPQGYKLRFVHQAGKDALVEVVSTTKFGPPSRPEPQKPSEPSRPSRPDGFNPSPAPVQPSRPGPWAPPTAQAVEAKVWSGDPAQRISHDSTGQIRISGLADGSSPDPRINLYFDGRDVNVALDQGMTPYETFQAIAAAMPQGYKANLVFQAPHSHADVLIEVKKSPSANEGDWLK